MTVAPKAKAPKTAAPAPAPEVADPDEIERPGKPPDRDDMDDRARSYERAERFHDPGSYGYVGPGE